MKERAIARVRSRLFTPATRPDRFDKAAASGADVLILSAAGEPVPGDDLSPSQPPRR